MYVCCDGLRMFRQMKVSLLRPCWRHSNHGELLFLVVVMSLYKWPEVTTKINDSYI